MEKLYSVKYFADLIGVTKKALTVWEKEGKLAPIILPSGHKRYNGEHLVLVNKLNLRVNCKYLKV